MSSELKKSPQNLSLTVAKALKVLDSFTLDAPNQSVREIAHQLNINPTSVFRIIRTFTETGYMEQDSNTGRYRIGPKVLELAHAYSRQNPLAEIANSVFTKYSRKFEYNFYLGALSEYQVVYLAVLDGRGPISIRTDPGQRLSLHATALGKILLAFASEDIISTVIKNGLPRYTPQTITDPNVLLAELPRIRELGLAYNNGEQYDEVASFAVPIYNKFGQVISSLSIAFPRWLFSKEKAEDYTELLRQMSNEIMSRF